jgi:drug/metabolite transporter (DMT)-like permease
MAYLLYGERLSPLQLLGTLLVVVGVALLEWRAVHKG